MECQKICERKCQIERQIECQRIFEHMSNGLNVVGITRRELFYEFNSGYTEFLGTAMQFLSQSPFSLSQKLNDSTGCGGTSRKVILEPPGRKINERIERIIIQYLHKTIGFQLILVVSCNSPSYKSICVRQYCSNQKTDFNG